MLDDDYIKEYYLLGFGADLSPRRKRAAALMSAHMSNGTDNPAI